MKTPEEIKKGLECCPGQYSSIGCGKCPYSIDGRDCGRNGDQPMKDALIYIQQLEASYGQVSKALCGKENATLDEVLQAVSQVKNPVVDGIDGGKMQLDAYLRSIKSKLKYAEAERDVRSKLAIEQAQRIADLLQCRESYIFDLETELEAVKRERDAAIAIDVRKTCNTCKHKRVPSIKEPCNTCIMAGDGELSGWQWRGVCPENTEVQE